MDRARVVDVMSAQDERPFIIWTFRRTGGTSLRRMLYWLSTFKAWQDEAFNLDRELGTITRAFLDRGNVDEIERAIGDVIVQQKNLKHCIEVVPYAVSSALLRTSLSRGYRHVVLLRANEVDRQISLEIARLSGAWGPQEAEAVFSAVKERRREMPPLNLGAMQQQMQTDALILGRLLRLLHANRASYSMVFFEDFYTGPFEDRVANIRQLCKALSLFRASEEKDGAFRDSLMDRDQGTKDIYSYVPNIDEGRALVEAYTR